MVTVETALTIGVVVVAVALLIAGLTAAGKQAQVCTVSREAARAYSIGQNPNAAATAIDSEVSIEISDTGNMVSVTGKAPGINIGGIKIGELSCQVATLNEQNWSS